MFRRVVPIFLLLPVALCHPGAHVGRAGAHPGGQALGQRVELTLTAEGEGVLVDLVYVAELPVVRVHSEARPMGLLPGVPTPAEALDRYAARLSRELGDNLRVAWDGARVEMERLDDVPTSRPGDQGFVELPVHRRGRVPVQTGTLVVSHGNFPDEGGYFATSVAVDGALVVTASSLAGVKDGRVTRNRHGAWLRDEAAREQSVSLAPAGFWARRDGHFALPERLAELDTLAAPLRELAVGLGVLLVAAGAGVWWWQGRRAA